LIVLNAVYWPFHDDDAVSIYAFQSADLPDRHLPTGEGLCKAYPMLLPLSHVLVICWLAGNEYLAKSPVTALGVRTLGAVAALGLTLPDYTGLMAGVLLL
jgi:hypothetical protein